MIIQAPRVDYDPKDVSSASILGKAKGLYSTSALQLSSMGLNTQHIIRSINGHSVNISLYKNNIGGFIYGTIRIEPIGSLVGKSIIEAIPSWQDDSSGSFILSGGQGKYIEEFESSTLEYYPYPGSGNDAIDPYPTLDIPDAAVFADPLFYRTSYNSEDKIGFLSKRSGSWIDLETNDTLSCMHDKVYYKGDSYTLNSSFQFDTFRWSEIRSVRRFGSRVLLLLHIKDSSNTNRLEMHLATLKKTFYKPYILEVDDTVLWESESIVYSFIFFYGTRLWMCDTSGEDTVISYNKIRILDNVLTIEELASHTIPSWSYYSDTSFDNTVQDWGGSGLTLGLDLGNSSTHQAIKGGTNIGPLGSDFVQDEYNKIMQIYVEKNKLSLLLRDFNALDESRSTLDESTEFRVYDSSNFLYTQSRGRIDTTGDTTVFKWEATHKYVNTTRSNYRNTVYKSLTLSATKLSGAYSLLDVETILDTINLDISSTSTLTEDQPAVTLTSTDLPGHLGIPNNLPLNNVIKQWDYNSALWVWGPGAPAFNQRGDLLSNPSFDESQLEVTTSVSSSTGTTLDDVVYNVPLYLHHDSINDIYIKKWLTFIEVNPTFNTFMYEATSELYTEGSAIRSDVYNTATYSSDPGSGPVDTSPIVGNGDYNCNLYNIPFITSGRRVVKHGSNYILSYNYGISQDIILLNTKDLSTFNVLDDTYHSPVTLTNL